MRPRRFVLAAMILVAGSAFSFDSTPTERAQGVVDNPPLASIPITSTGQLSWVEVTVNGEGPFKFVFDDGMTTTVIDQRLVEKLKLNADGEVRIDSLGFGGFKLEDVQAQSADLTEVWGEGARDGLIGLNLFSDYLATLDLPAQQLILRRGELPPADGDEILNYALVPRSSGEAFDGRQVATINVSIGDETLTVDFAPSSWGALTLNSDHAEKLSLTSAPGVIGETQNDEGTFPILGAGLEEPLAIAGHHLKNPGVYFSEAFDHPAIGSSQLDPFVITYDQNHQRVRIHKPNTANNPMLAKAAGLVRQAGQGADLKTTFNQEMDKVRLMVLLSPT
jgi:hypothetical protein